MTVLGLPIDWQTIQSSLYSWASGALGSSVAVRWGQQHRPEAYPFVILEMISGPLKTSGWDVGSSTTDLTRVRDVKVTPIAANTTTYTVDINGNAAAFVSDASATVAEITAGLKTNIDALGEPVVVVDNGTDLDIQGDPETLNPGTPQLFNIILSDDGGGSPLLSFVNNDIGNEVEIDFTGWREATLNVQAFVRSTDASPIGADMSQNAERYLTILNSSLESEEVRQTLFDNDIAVIDASGVTDISTPVADTFESRASMDIRLRIVSSLKIYRGYIEDVSGEGTVNPGSISDPYLIDN